MSYAFASILQMKKMLLNLDKWLEKSINYAKEKSFEPAVLLNCRLIADMYPLLRQVQSCCDTAKFAAARLSGQEAPKHPDTEQTIDEIRARIRTCVDYLETFKESDFTEADTRLVSLSYIPDKVLLGSDYLVEMVFPNFYFHITTAYDILRHNGVDVGKMDYIGSLTLRDK
jgi:hypothetical protein